MNWLLIGLSVTTLLALAMVLTYVLGWASQAFYVEPDPRVEAILEELPGINCGGCGCVGCGEFAEAVAAGEAPVDRCVVGGPRCAAAVAQIMGVTLEESLPLRPVIHCRADHGMRLLRQPYRGEKSCVAGHQVSDIQGCTYGCLGFGDCVRACNFDALQVVNGLAVIDYAKCTSCGACAKACPRKIIAMTPFAADEILVVACANREGAKDVKKKCTTGCTACRICEKMSQNLFTVDDQLSSIDYDAYTTEEAEQALSKEKQCPRNLIVYQGKRLG